jgi:hypothetical protein
MLNKPPSENVTETEDYKRLLRNLFPQIGLARGMIESNPQRAFDKLSKLREDIHNTLQKHRGYD